jgi:hypothetical protein
VGPAGFEPATQRIQAQLLFGLCITLFYGFAMYQAVKGSVTTHIALPKFLSDGTMPKS